jgi:2-oxoglutarate ferredoxin oxidoreductase subunit gamma
MTYKIIIAGFGGQGVLSLGQFIAYSATFEGKNVTWLPSYGPEMRGGTANCHVTVSDVPIANPIITNPDCLIALNLPSLIKFEDAVLKDGLIILNASLISEPVRRKDLKTLRVPADELGAAGGNKKASNIALLGVLIKDSKILKPENVIKGIEYMLKNKPQLVEVNKKVFELGLNG